MRERPGCFNVSKQNRFGMTSESHDLTVGESVGSVGENEGSLDG